MNTDPKGSSTNIIGSIIAKAPAEPIPGKTPTIVPNKEPKSAYIKYLTCRMILKPSIKFINIVSNI